MFGTERFEGKDNFLPNQLGKSFPRILHLTKILHQVWRSVMELKGLVIDLFSLNTSLVYLTFRLIMIT